MKPAGWLARAKQKDSNAFGTIAGRGPKERLVAVLEMTSLSQSPRDRILWILTEHGGKMERSRLRRRMGMRYALLNPLLEELVKEGRIKMTAGKDGDMVSLIER